MKKENEKPYILFSVGTYFAYKIAKMYYNNVHYVWCTSEFDAEDQPPTSNPKTICKRYLEQIRTGDRHTNEINNNKSGILKGAKIKFEAGIINRTQYKEIRCLVNAAEYEAFIPVIYVISVDKIKNSEIRCKEVAQKDRASNNSIEYIIEDLKENEFKIINLNKVLCDVMNVAERKAGE